MTYTLISRHDESGEERELSHAGKWIPMKDRPVLRMSEAAAMLKARYVTPHRDGARVLVSAFY